MTLVKDLVKIMEGAIPSNLLQIPNTTSNSRYLRHCRQIGVKGHPARFPEKLPSFFIEFLTDKGDTVLDIFAGSNTTGAVCERLSRKWAAFELEQKYLAASAFRFTSEMDEKKLASLYDRLCATPCDIALPLESQQYLELNLMTAR